MEIRNLSNLAGPATVIMTKVLNIKIFWIDNFIIYSFT